MDTPEQQQPEQDSEPWTESAGSQPQLPQQQEAGPDISSATLPFVIVESRTAQGDAFDG